MMNILLGVDLGTTKLCTVALDADHGTLLALDATPNNASTTVRLGDGEQDAGCMIAKALDCLKRIAAHPDSPRRTSDRDRRNRADAWDNPGRR